MFGLVHTLGILAVVLTGPRRAGKTSLRRRLFPEAGYFMLEDLDVVARLRADPQGFLDAVKLGYATCQLGKNHLGDQNAHLPTVHGFDEFFGYLYHLNAMEEPEDPDFPKGAPFKARFGSRNMVDATASEKDDPTQEPRSGRVGKQVVKDAGALTRKRMETVEEEFLAHSLAFIEKSAKANKPFFLWQSSSRLHESR